MDLDKFTIKLNRWNQFYLSLARRILITINHILIPVTLVFLSCWRPPECALQDLHKLCKRFIWIGTTDREKISKVKWELYILSKDKGGLRTLNITNLANRLVGKWILSSLLLPHIE